MALLTPEDMRTHEVELEDSMKHVDDILQKVWTQRSEHANVDEITSNIETLKVDLMSTENTVRMLLLQIKKQKWLMDKEKKQLNEFMAKIKAYETEAKVLCAHQNSVAMISKKDFAELRRMMHPSKVMRDIFTAIAILFEVPNWQKWSNVQKFIASSSTQSKILRLKPEDVRKETVIKVRKYIDEHKDSINRLTAWKANKKIAPLEPWLRIIVSLAERLAIDKIQPSKVQEELVERRRRSTAYQSNVDNLALTVAKAEAAEHKVVKALQNLIWERRRSMGQLDAEEEKLTVRRKLAIHNNVGTDDLFFDFETGDKNPFLNIRSAQKRRISTEKISHQDIEKNSAISIVRKEEVVFPPVRRPSETKPITKLPTLAEELRDETYKPINLSEKKSPKSPKSPRTPRSPVRSLKKLMNRWRDGRSKEIQRNDGLTLDSECSRRRPEESAAIKARNGRPLESVAVRARNDRPEESAEVEATSGRPAESEGVAARNERPEESAAVKSRSGRPLESAAVRARNERHNDEILDISEMPISELAEEISRCAGDIDVEEQMWSDQDEKDFEDTILRWNAHKRSSITYTTEVFEIWEKMGASFRTGSSPRSSKKKKKKKKKEKKNQVPELGYNVVSSDNGFAAPWMSKVEEMRQTRNSGRFSGRNKYLLRNFKSMSAPELPEMPSHNLLEKASSSPCMKGNDGYKLKSESLSKLII